VAPRVGATCALPRPEILNIAGVNNRAACDYVDRFAKMQCILSRYTPGAITSEPLLRALGSNTPGSGLPTRKTPPKSSVCTKLGTCSSVGLRKARIRWTDEAPDKHISKSRKHRHGTIIPELLAVAYTALVERQVVAAKERIHNPTSALNTSLTHLLTVQTAFADLGTLIDLNIGPSADSRFDCNCALSARKEASCTPELTSLQCDS
jgi:hypothetical protein